MKNFWNFFLNNRHFSYIILIALVLFGFQAVINIPRESAPEVQVPVAVITTILPGASALDIESLITNEIEDRLNNNLENVDNITSTSREGISNIIIEFDADADLDKSIQDTKDEVDLVKSELPNEAEDPIVSEVNFIDQPVISISFISDLPKTELIKLVDEVESELESVKNVSRVEGAGIPEREVQILVRKEALNQYNLSITDIVRSLQSANSSLPVGSIDIDGISYAVIFEGEIKDPEEVKNIAIVRQGGGVLYIRDVADVINGISNLSNYSRVSLDGEPSKNSVTLSIFKRRGGDVTRMSNDVRDKLKELESGLLEDVPYLISFDNGEFVKDDLRNLSLTALQTVILVMIILFISIGWREALIAGLSIPLSFLVAFIGLNLSGNTINFVSLFSLILSVGILVDSAIVVTEAIHTKMKGMKDKIESARETINEFYYPLTSGTATTIAVFAPLFLLSGVTGQFIAGIPYTLIFVLVASLFVALGIVPLIASIVLKRRARSRMEEKQEEYTHKLQDWYRNLLRKIVGNKKREKRFILGVIGLFIITLTFPFIGFVKVIFFPQEDIDFLFVEIERPQGTLLEYTDLSVREVEEVLYSNGDIESFVTEVGRGSFFNEGSSSGQNIANITILLNKDRKNTSSEVLKDLREEVAFINSAEIRVSEPNNGPPTGDPVFIQFFGNDIGELNKVVLRAESLLEDISGTTEVTSSAKTDATEFSLQIDRAKAAQFGLDPSAIAFTLRTAIFGTDAITINNPDGDIDVNVRLNLNENVVDPERSNETTIDSIKKISIPTYRGPVLIGSLVKSDLKSANSVINHKDTERVGTVSSQIEDGVSVQEIIKEFTKREGELNLPSGVRISFGGETEDVNKSFKEMGIALILGIILIASILVLQFKSFKQALFVIAVVPASLIGVFIGLALSGKALSFPSMMGFIALSGIVVNNSIILIDSMNKIRKEYPHYPIDDVVINASVSRFRPILLTTLTTVIGIIPLTYAAGLWSPLAFAIMFGLTFAVVITLILVPILYARWPGKG